jgi:hypothetical protein
MPQTTLTPSMSVVERFSEVSSGDFEHEPIEGVSILACTTGQLLGYQAFHGQPEPAALLPYFRSRQ